MLKKNDIFELTIDDVTLEGSGVGRLQGMAVFVPAAAAGDVIRCRIVKVLKSMAYGIAEEILVPSPDRADRGCGVRRTCGGCVFRDISYEAELSVKGRAVENAFVRMGGFPRETFELLPVLGCEVTDRYRNKAQYPVTVNGEGKAVCGFYAKRSHRVAPCDDCLLQPEIFGDIVREILGGVNRENIPVYDEGTGRGLLRHIYLRRGHYSGEIMVCPVVTREEMAFTDILKGLPGRFPGIKSIVLNINRDRSNVILGKKYVTVWGEDVIRDRMCGNEIRLSPGAFYQVNTPQAERLYRQAAEFAGLTGTEEVLDLYCGAGTIGLYLARSARRVTGAEIVREAVENARANAAANGIGNIDFICADAGEAAEHFAREGRRPRVIVTDPPRKGCDVLTLESIVKMSPERVVMVSCNPATAARDCRFLADRGYSLIKLRAVDMFPGAGHVETVCLLSKLKSDQHIEVELKTDELDLTSAESKATYDEIKDYIKEHTGLTVSSLNIAQVKQKCGIIERENYNKAKSKDSRQPKCTKEKEEAIMEALEHFSMI